MSDEESVQGEDLGEAGEDGGQVKKNPLGTYDGHRNDKNERHGRGRAALPNGDLYLGCYFKGQRHGLGIYRYKNGNGARYGGDWVFNVKKGWGAMYYPDGAQYTGNWDRNLRHGWGIYVYPNGDEFEGWWYYGKRNGRGIYRTKATDETFVGEWRLGKRHGPGMIIRKHHRFIGDFFNDAPKGPGVYIFPELQCEQHGKYTHMKCREGGEDRWVAAGYQVRRIRGTPPMDDPLGVEQRHRAIVETTPEVQGEGVFEELKPEQIQQIAQSLDDRVCKYMMKLITEEAVGDESKTPIVPMWRVVEITGLITAIPDETVPPPPMPSVPLPPPQPEPELVEEKIVEQAKETTEEDPVLVARREAATHMLDPFSYTGQGACELDSVTVKLPGEVEPYAKFSEMSLSKIDELREQVEATGGQLEPLDIEAAMRANENHGHGMDMADRWRDCLADGTCEVPDVPAPPGGHTTAEHSAPHVHSSAMPTSAESGVGHAIDMDNSGYDAEEVSEPAHNPISETTEEYTTDEYDDLDQL